MAPCIPKQDRGICPAFSYCRALESYGVLTLTDECLFENSKGSWMVSLETARALVAATSHTLLAEALIKEAALERNRLAKTEATITNTEPLISARKDIFAARMRLWRAMLEASRQQRPFTDVELSYFTTNIKAAQADYLQQAAKVPEELRLSAGCAYDKALKSQYSLQFDAPMIEDINRLVGNMLNTRPTLLVGDKGIAKTQVAKFVMGLTGADPIVLSVKGDMMSDELIGKLKHDAARNTFVFQEGVLLTAMREGLPVLLDELNFGDQAIIARLQDILLKQPGETVFIQESGEESIKVAPGFVVLATANEASQRYRHRAILDPAIRDRFDIIMRNYPDLDIDPLLETSSSLLRLALSSAVDSWGIPTKHIDLGVLEKFVRLAHVTQYLYAVPGKNINIRFEEDHIASSVLEESQPLMTDCITPRTLSKAVLDCAAGNLPGVSFNNNYITSVLAALDQAGSTHNASIAEHVSVLLDFEGDDSNLSWLPEEERELISPRSGTKKASQGVFEGLSEKAFALLLDEDSDYL